MKIHSSKPFLFYRTSFTCLSGTIWASSPGSRDTGEARELNNSAAEGPRQVLGSRADNCPHNLLLPAQLWSCTGLYCCGSNYLYCIGPGQLWRQTRPCPLPSTAWGGARCGSPGAARGSAGTFLADYTERMMGGHCTAATAATTTGSRDVLLQQLTGHCRGRGGGGGGAARWQQHWTMEMRIQVTGCALLQHRIPPVVWRLEFNMPALILL